MSKRTQAQIGGTQDCGAFASEPGSREPDPQAVPALTGFDPSRDVIRKTALISPCGTYRYRLTRHWDSNLPPMTFVMLNPSTADSHIDDPTIRRCMGFARRENMGGIVVVNLYAFRATSPAEMLRARDRCGPANDGQLRDALAGSVSWPVVCAWGANASTDAAGGLIEMARDEGVGLVSLGVTKDGHPRHPLYVRADQPFVAFPASAIEARSDKTGTGLAEGESAARRETPDA